MRYLSLLATAFLVLAAFATARAEDITIYFNPTPMPYLKAAMADWEKETGHKVTYLTAPATSTDTIALYQQQLAAGTSDVDLYQIDTIWPGLIGTHLLDLKPHLQGREKEFVPAAIANDTVDGRLVALPLYLDTGLIYYRKDLLEKHNLPVPNTWPELEETARTIMKAEREAGNPRMWGYVFQGRAYEGLTCNALEWIASYGGGAIVDAEGKVTVNNPQAAAALKRAASWIGDISPEGVLNYAEEEVRGVFQSGDAVFMRNWNYCWALAQREDSKVRGVVGVMAVPAGVGPGARHASTLGGWNIAVNKYSKRQAAALELLDYLTGREGLKKFMLQGAYVPGMVSLFEDPEIVAATPLAKLENYSSSVPRPTSVLGSSYNRVSSEFYNAAHSVLSKTASAENALADLESSLKRIGRRGW